MTDPADFADPDPADSGPAVSSPADKSRLLAELRDRVRRLEGIGGGDGTAVAPLGVPDLDRHLPGGGLPLGAVHEVVGPDPRLDAGAATGFAAVLLGRLSAGRGPVLWVARGRDLYAPGLAALGLDTDRLILVRADGDADALWAMEEALRCAAVGAVLGEAGEPDLAASRRLQLAAEAGGVPGLLLRLGPRRVGTSACVTRWRVEAVPSGAAGVAVGLGQDDGAGVGLPGLGPAAWRAELLRCRGGRPGAWLLAWLGTRLEGRPAAAEPAGGIAAAGQGLGTQRVAQLRVAGRPR
ncbi:MAG TPA: hypothetical protein VEB20_12290 [Azospirillaceae bacterium]|nr:hypothetical protein [Azospirillaceae bacterium]